MPTGTSLATLVDVHVPRVPIRATMSGGQLTSGLSSVVTTTAPNQIPGLLAWYDASGILGVPSGASLSIWTDISGNGNHLTQASAGSQPTWIITGQNGLGVVRFASASKQIMTTSAVSQGPPFTMVSAYKTTGGANLSVCGGQTGSGRPAIDQFAIGTAAVGTSIANVQASGISSNDTWLAIAGIFSASTTTLILRHSSSTTKTGSIVPTESALSFGIGGGFVAGGFMNGDVGEVAFYSTGIDNQNMQGLLNYFTTKWGIPVA